jgi:hypothetical protein
MGKAFEIGGEVALATGGGHVLGGPGGRGTQMLQRRVHEFT